MLKHSKWLYLIPIVIFILLFLTTGCSPTTKDYIITTEYQKVEIPVVYKIDRPSRPTFTTQSTPVYLSQLLAYVELLETLIDEQNRGE